MPLLGRKDRAGSNTLSEVWGRPLGVGSIFLSSEKEKREPENGKASIWFNSNDPIDGGIYMGTVTLRYQTEDGETKEEAFDPRVEYIDLSQKSIKSIDPSPLSDCTSLQRLKLG